MPLIQGELNKVAIHWNLHKIRPSHNVGSPSGRPDVLYYVPAWTNATDYRTEVDLDDIDVIDGVCCDRTSPIYCLEECRELIDIIMQEQQLQLPSTALEARNLFRGSSLLHRQQLVQFLYDFFRRGKNYTRKPSLMYPQCHPLFVYEALLAKEDRQF